MFSKFEVLQHGSTYHLGKDPEIECPECGEIINLLENPPSVPPFEPIQEEGISVVFTCFKCGCIFVATKEKEKDK